MRKLKFRAWTGTCMVQPDLASWDDFFILPDGDIGFMEDGTGWDSSRFLAYRSDCKYCQPRTPVDRFPSARPFLW